MVRTSVTIPLPLYEILKRFAAERDVSIAVVIRAALRRVFYDTTKSTPR